MRRRGSRGGWSWGDCMAGRSSPSEASRGHVAALVELFGSHGIAVTEEEGRQPMGTAKRSSYSSGGRTQSICAESPAYQETSELAS